MIDSYAVGRFTTVRNTHIMFLDLVNIIYVDPTLYEARVKSLYGWGLCKQIVCFFRRKAYVSECPFDDCLLLKCVSKLIFLNIQPVVLIYYIHSFIISNILNIRCRGKMITKGREPSLMLSYSQFQNQRQIQQFVNNLQITYPIQYHNLVR